MSQVLKEACYKSEEELERFKIVYRNTDISIDNDFDLSDATLHACSKFTLTLTGPDFTTYKVEDPFRSLGPIAIFSARRHWTAPRCARLHKGTALYRERQIYRDCNCPSDHEHEIGCLLDTYKSQSAESFGFHVRGESPSIIAHVEINSLADVRFFT